MHASPHYRMARRAPNTEVPEIRHGSTMHASPHYRMARTRQELGEVHMTNGPGGMMRTT